MEQLESKNFVEEIVIDDLNEGRISAVATRFPPEPNGYLHVGHAKSICLNFGIAKKFGGTCNLRFDDTNPTKEDEEYVNAIYEDIHWLGFDWDGLFYASDYFDRIYECAELLIKKGLAYVCDLSAEEIRAYRGTLTEPGKNSPYRDRTPEENLDLFRRMRAGEFADGEKVLRAKIDMASPNINMRDPVIYRILRAHHHRTGDKWLIYPMYDFAHPLSDAFEGITHSICTLEFEDHRPFYDWAVDNCDIEKKPHQYEFARLNLTNTVMSKRYLKRLVENGSVDGWDDPRMPTICGLRRRGYTPAALRDFCERIGVAKANSEVDYRNLEACVRDDLNVTTPRVMAVLDPLKVTIVNYEGSETFTIENNPSDPEGGTREVSFSRELYIDRADFSDNPPPKYFRLKPDGMVRLKGAYIIKCERVIYAEDGSVAELECSYIPESKSGNDVSGLKVKGVIQWVDGATGVDITARKFESLLLPAQFSGQDFSERMNEDSVHIFHGKAERAVDEAPFGTRFQFMRLGYYIKDEKSGTYGEIVSLKDSFGK